MTFKSIATILHEAETAGRLVRFCPDFDPDESEIREIFMTPELHEWVWRPEGRKDFKPKIRQHLKRFVIVGLVDNSDFMKSWRDDVFEFRVQFQDSPPVEENTRIFGAFAKQDSFVASRWKPRGWFESGERRWDTEIEKVMNEWAALMQGRGRTPSKPFRNCIGDNGWDQERDERW